MILKALEIILLAIILIIGSYIVFCLIKAIIEQLRK